MKKLNQKSDEVMVVIGVSFKEKIKGLNPVVKSYVGGIR